MDSGEDTVMVAGIQTGWNIFNSWLFCDSQGHFSPCESIQCEDLYVAYQWRRKVKLEFN